MKEAVRRECEETRGGEKKVAQLDPGPGLPRSAPVVEPMWAVSKLKWCMYIL